MMKSEVRPMPSGSLTLGLFEEGLSHLHRAGLAGLALS
ncbi:MAG: hypothetical protein HQM09_19600, partial [Candidatus Riflebacteria bacterium]|nr:hypothetical protein [Candidatus Riflebacteria bacterium]